MNLFQLADLQPADLHRIWSLVNMPAGAALQGTVAWSLPTAGPQTPKREQAHQPT